MRRADARWVVITGVALSATGAAPASAAPQEPTRVLVRVVAHDAKVVGSGVGGARITIRNAASGELLADGVQEGSTGSTEAIMLTPRLRGLTAFGADSEAAGFVAALDLERPTTVEIAAEGPLGTPHALQRAMKTLLLVPGRHVLGEGVILELHGFTVELLAPSIDEGEPIPVGGEPIPVGGEPIPVPSGPIEVRAKVTMLCGCPTEPGGLWDSEQMEIVARLILDGEVAAETPLVYAGEASVHVGTLPDPGPGPAAIEVIAADPARANFGLVRRAILVSE